MMSHLIQIGEVIFMSVYWGRNAEAPCLQRGGPKHGKPALLLSVLSGPALVLGIHLIFANWGLEYIAVMVSSVLSLYLLNDISIRQCLHQSTLCWIDLMLIRLTCCIVYNGLGSTIPISDLPDSYMFLYSLELSVAMGIGRCILYASQSRVSDTENKHKDITSGVLLLVEWGVTLASGWLLDNFWLSAVIALSCLSVIFMVDLVFSLFENYWRARLRAGALIKENQLLCEQYSAIKENYEIKKQLVHDFKNQNILLRQYLKNGQTEAALAYLDTLDEKLADSRTEFYSGVPVIDFILDYKIKEAQKYGVRVDWDIEVHICPLPDIEMCVVMGNLLDNSIEAVCDLAPERRCIHIFMKIVNDAFMLEVGNPYAGKLRKADGRYLTTKPNSDSHGLGIASVEKIVEAHHGSVMITDSDHYFKTQIILYEVSF